MKKFLMYAGGAGVLQLINSEILTWAVLAVLASVALVKYLPLFMEGTR